MFIAVMHVVAGRAAKFAEFALASEAQAHVASFSERWPDAFVVEKPSENPSEWWFEGPAVSLVPVVTPVAIPDRVSARQFKMALHAAGLLATVEGWIDLQGPLVRIAYDNSGTFVRSEPMMAAGFAALGFTDEQIDAFFASAAAI